MWVAVIVVVVLVLAGAYYLIAQEGKTNTNNGNTVNTEGNTNAGANENVNAETNSNTAVNTNTTANTNSVVDTSGWRTYNDETYQFSVRHPASWSLKVYETGYNDEGTYAVVFTTGRSVNERLPFITVRKDWSASDEIARIEASDPPLSRIVSNDETQVGNWPATEIVYSTAIGIDFRKFVIVHESTSYMFDSTRSDDDFRAVASTLSFN